jgi:hypothetical protein
VELLLLGAAQDVLAPLPLVEGCVVAPDSMLITRWH